MSERCPECERQIAEGAATCRCGWVLPRLPASAPAAAPDLVEIERQRVAAERARAWMEANGLKTPEDCSAFVRRQARGNHAHMRTLSKFEAWCESMKQSAVDWLVRDRITNPETEKVLRRLRAAAVIDEHNRLIPLPNRPALRAKLDAERAAADAELLARRRVPLPDEAEQQGEGAGA